MPDIIEQDVNRDVQRIRRYNHILYWLTQTLAISSVGAFLLTFVWFGFGMKENHWTFYLMGGAYAISTLLLLGSLLLGRRENKLSDGNCHRCGGEIQGGPPEDWVMQCEDCGQEWVYAGNMDGDSDV